jgi:hypothetical protein
MKYCRKPEDMEGQRQRERSRCDALDKQIDKQREDWKKAHPEPPEGTGSVPVA